MLRRVALMCAIGSTALFAESLAFGQDVLHTLDTSWGVSPSDIRIAVQFDTTSPPPQKSVFFFDHPTLDAAAPVQSLDRGFEVYGIDSESDYETAAADVTSDQAVNRCLPVYIVLHDSSEFRVTDLVDVRFEDGLSEDSAIALLAAHGLVLTDTNAFSHNLWEAALEDSIKISPLSRANALHLEDAVVWAAPAIYVRTILHSQVTDPYFPNQYYLEHTGQFGGVPDTDLDADSAWLFTLCDSSLRVAVIDDGFESNHPDLAESRLVNPFDFYDMGPDPTPGSPKDNHGMACAGILAASHNDSGIAGVFGSCELVPIRKPFGTITDLKLSRTADAIRYAWEQGARVISCSWGYGTTIEYSVITEAIQQVSDVCEGGSEDASVVVFSVGNEGSVVTFPASLDETIGVGGVSKQNVPWWWSNTGPAVDVVATTGPLAEWVGDTLVPMGDIWTVDRVGDLGWNPLVTWEPLENHDYTARFGGTSAACPQVAGLIALVAAKRPDLMDDCRPVDVMRDILCQSAEYFSEDYEPQEVGCGHANAFRALLAVGRGEVSNDGVYNDLDAIMIINQAFRGAGPQGLHPGHADMNCDGVINVLDVVRIVNIAFRSGAYPDPCFRYDGYTTETQ